MEYKRKSRDLEETLVEIMLTPHHSALNVSTKAGQLHSMLKRVFGLRRCNWKGWAHFQQYVGLSITSFNLLVLARLLL